MKRILYILALTFLAASCDWLAITPENSIDEDDLFTSGYGYRNALNGIYLKIGSRDLYGENLSWGFLSAAAQEYLTDNSQQGQNSVQISKDAADFIYNSTSTQPVIQTIWETQYSVIANINKIIEHIDNIDKSEFAFGEDEKNLIKAEAYALRAMLHFDLLRLFAPAPATNPAGTYLPYREKFGPEIGEKLSVTAFIEKCIKDISVAEPLLKHFDTEYHPVAMSTNMSTGSSVSWSTRFRFDSKMHIDEFGEFFWYRGWRMNYMAVLALKARVCHYAGSGYTPLAKTAAKEIYDNFYKAEMIGFSPASNITCQPEIRYFKAFDDVIMGAYYPNLATEYDEGLYGNDNTVRYPLANIDNLFASDNTGIYSDYRYQYLIKKSNTSNQSYYHGKYSVATESIAAAISNPMVPLFRLSEICYILAEISADEKNVAAGVEYLKAVRTARGALRDISLTVSTPAQLKDEILLDARKDLMCEGQVFFMLKRRNIESIESSSRPGFYRNMTEGYVLPIPTSESPF